MKILITENQRSLIRRISRVGDKIGLSLMRNNVCEYSRYEQYRRVVINDAISMMTHDEEEGRYPFYNLSANDLFNFRDQIIPLFDEKIRNHYDKYGDGDCSDDSDVMLESQINKLDLRRRCREIKSWVKSDYQYLLRQEYYPENAKEIVIDHSAFSYLDDSDNDLKFTDENLHNLRQFIEDNFEDLITESQITSFGLRRRLLHDPEYITLMKDIITEGFDYTEVCDYDYDGGFKDFLHEILNGSSQTFINTFSEFTKLDDLQINEIDNFVYSFMEQKFGNSIKRSYHDRLELCNED